MDIETLLQIGFSKTQAKVYLYLVEHGQSTPSKIASDLGENRTTVYSALERLKMLEIIKQKDKGKIAAFVPNHPSALESLAEKRLRTVARQAKNLESTLPDLINYYNEHQFQPGVATFYGQEGIDFIHKKIVSTGKTLHFVRSRYDESANPAKLEAQKKAQVAAGIHAENITPSEFVTNSESEAAKWLLERTFLPPSEYDSPIEIDIFGDNVAFINYAKDGMSTLIESPEIADAMRQFFKFAKKYIRKAVDQSEYKEKLKS